MAHFGNDWARRLHAGFVYPVIVRSRGEGGVFAALADLEHAERLPADALRMRQQSRLRDTLQYAFDHSRYYASRWKAIGRLTIGRDIDEYLAGLPLLTKSDVQDHFDSLVAHPRIRRVTAKTTGGSTGQAVTILKDRSATAREMAASWLGYGWFGIRMGDRAARFWGSPHALKRELRFAAADFAMNRIRFSAFAFDDRSLESYWNSCLKFRPRYFYGYVSMLEQFAEFLQGNSIDGRTLNLKAIVTTSEVLTEPQRRLIEGVFEAPVQNEYGCGEVGPIAYECESGSLHLMTENLFVELVDEEGRPVPVGESGEIVVTDLNNRAMPLIRYRLGDYGIMGFGCSCGRGFPVLDRVWGREYDFVCSPSGHRYHGEFFMYLFEDLRASGVPIRQFQVTQTSPTDIEVLVAVDERCWSEAEQKIAAAFRVRLKGMRFTIRRTETIARAPSGKMRIILNPWLRARGGSQGNMSTSTISGHEHV